VYTLNSVAAVVAAAVAAAAAAAAALLRHQIESHHASASIRTTVADWSVLENKKIWNDILPLAAGCMPVIFQYHS